ESARVRLVAYAGGRSRAPTDCVARASYLVSGAGSERPGRRRSCAEPIPPPDQVVAFRLVRAHGDRCVEGTDRGVGLARSREELTTGGRQPVAGQGDTLQRLETRTRPGNLGERHRAVQPDDGGVTQSQQLVVALDDAVPRGGLLARGDGVLRGDEGLDQ